MSKKKIQFQTVKDRKKQVKKSKRTYYLPKEKELNVWLPEMADEQYFQLPEEYHSSSGIMSFFRQDAKSKEIFEFVKNKTPSLQIGSLIHAHLLTPEILPSLEGMVQDIEKRFPAVEPEEEVEAELDGRKYKSRYKRKPSAMERVEMAVAAAQENDEFMAELEGTVREYAGIVEDFHGISARIKGDAMHFENGVLSDVKTSTKSLKAFTKDVLSENPQIPYRIQAAFYVDVANHINELMGIPHRFKTFKWLFVSTKRKESGVVVCPPEVLEKGRQEVRIYIEAMKNAKKQ